MADKILNSFDVWIAAQGWKSKLRLKSVDNVSFEGLAKLRELILELAVRGKLVPQDSLNEPANLLLKESEIEKNRLVTDGKIRKHKELEQISTDQIPFVLPNGWQWAWFADLYFFQEGPGIRNWQFRSDGIKLLNVQNIVNNKLVLENTDKFIDIDEYNQKYLHFTIEENDLVFASSGGSWGKSAFFPNPGYKVIVNTSTVRIHPYVDRSSRSYLKCFLDSDLFKKQMVAQLVGMQPNFGSTHFLKVLVPVPPSSEQQKIGLKVDELMALCDELEQQETNHLKSHQLLVETLLGTLTQAKDAAEFQNAWATLAQHFDDLFITEDSIDQLKQTILQLAVMGKLVPQDPNDEPASELLERIKKEKERLIEDGVIKKQKELLEIGNKEKLFPLPKGWEWDRLNNLIDVRDGTHDSPKDASGSNTYPLVTSANFVNGKIDFDSARRISEEDHNEISKRSRVEKLDILFSMIGGNLGNQVIVEDDTEFSIKNVALFKYYDQGLTNPYFFKRYFEFLAVDLQTRAKGGAQPFVSLGFLRNLVFALPPIDEQKRIVKKVDELFALCDRLKERITEAQKVANLMADSILEQV